MTREEAASCINTIVILKNLCYRVRGLMDVIDARNCDKIIEMLNTVGETHKKHTETHACDTISRQDTITEIKNYERDSTAPIDYVKIVEQMTSVQPERKRGHWAINSDGYYPYCSECRMEPKSGDMTDFCPNCGADMRGLE